MDLVFNFQPRMSDSSRKFLYWMAAMVFGANNVKSSTKFVGDVEAYSCMRKLSALDTLLNECTEDHGRMVANSR